MKALLVEQMASAVFVRFAPVAQLQIARPWDAVEERPIGAVDLKLGQVPVVYEEQNADRRRSLLAEPFARLVLSAGGFPGAPGLDEAEDEDERAEHEGRRVRDVPVVFGRCCRAPDEEACSSDDRDEAECPP